jgi:HPt (histidine-containing phosphotransfer) domain-containing protein
MLHELVLQIEESHVPLKQAIETSDYTEFRHHAHGLKGAAANLNAERSAEIYKELEEMARNGQVNGAVDLLAQAEEAKDELKEYLNQL